MKLSVIVSTYNRPDALNRVLFGLIHQTILPDEIIVADDGSSSETREVIQKFIKKNIISITHVWQEDKGFRAAMVRNKAIMKVSGDYLIFLDGDCIPSRYFVADHKILAKKGCFFQGKRILVGEKLSNFFQFFDTYSIKYCLKQAIKGNIENYHHLFRIPFFPCFTDRSLSGTRSCNLGVYTEDIKAVNGFNHMFVGWGREDSELVHRLYLYGLKRRTNPFMAICFHLWHPEYDRNQIFRNNEILQKSISSDSYTCEHGLNTLL